jgi:hypothetical protein
MLSKAIPLRRAFFLVLFKTFPRKLSENDPECDYSFKEKVSLLQRRLFGGEMSVISFRETSNVPHEMKNYPQTFPELITTV